MDKYSPSPSDKKIARRHYVVFCCASTVLILFLVVGIKALMNIG